MEAGTKPVPAARRHLSGSILSVGLSRGTSLVAIAVTNIAITRMLGASGIGTVSISAALLFAFAVLFEVGLSQGTAYYASRSEWSGRHLAWGTILSCLVLGLLGTGLMLVAYSLVGNHVPGMTWTMAIALSAALPFALLGRVGPQVALAEERFELFALLDSSPMVLTCPLAIILAAIDGTSGAVIGVAAAVVISGAGVAIWLVRDLTRAERESREPEGGIKAVAAFGSRAWLLELLQQVNLRADLVLLGAFAGAAEAGIYSIALATTSIAWVLTEAFAVSALPRSARLQAESERQITEGHERDSRDSRLVRHTILVIPAVALLETLLLFVGIPLFYGSGFDRSITLGLILLAGSLVLGAGRAALAILLARGRPNAVLAVGIAIVPATLAAYALVVPWGGAIGVAVVSSVSYLALTLLAITTLCRATGLPMRDVLVPRAADVQDYGALASKLRATLPGRAA
jgi:O-antigen/teichoic acid export membrane protein